MLNLNSDLQDKYYNLNCLYTVSGWQVLVANALAGHSS